jgi:hypothetical protein
MSKRARTIEGVPITKIISEIERIRAQIYSEGGYSGKYDGKTVGELARREAEGGIHWYSPAMILIDAVLQMNRDYTNFVEPRMDYIYQKQPNLQSFSDLRRLINKHTKKNFLKKVWCYNDPGRYDLLCKILDNFIRLKRRYGLQKDKYVLKRWAKDFDLSDIDGDPVGKLYGVGIATCQYVRMQAGVNTSKPDRRVKASMRLIFLRSFSDVQAIHVVEKMSEVTGYNCLELDQILVNDEINYGKKQKKRECC